MREKKRREKCSKKYCWHRKIHVSFTSSRTICLSFMLMTLLSFFFFLLFFPYFFTGRCASVQTFRCPTFSFFHFIFLAICHNTFSHRRPCLGCCSSLVSPHCLHNIASRSEWNRNLI